MSENETETSLEVLQPSALHALERAQIDTQVATAHQYPRSIAQFKQRAMAMVTLDEETADSCIYCRPVGEGKFAEGPSIRMAEIVACSYGNIRVASRVVEQTPRYVKTEGVAHDLESNYAGKTENIESTVKRDGTPYSERQRALTAKVALAKSYRDSIFKVVPRALCKTLLDAAKKVTAGTGQPLEARRQKVQAWVNYRKIEEARVFAVLGVKGWADVNEQHLITITGLKTAIMDGDPVDEIFPPIDGQQSKQAAPTAFQQATAPQATNVTPLPTQPAAAVPPVSQNGTQPVRRRVGRPPSKPQDAPQPAEGVPTTPPTPAEAPPAPAGEAGTPAESPTGPAEQSDEAAEAAAGLAPQQPPPAAAPLEPFKARAGESEALVSVRLLLHKSGRTEEQVLEWLRKNKAAKDGQKLEHLSEAKLLSVSRAFNSFLQETAGEGTKPA